MISTMIQWQTPVRRPLHLRSFNRGSNIGLAGCGMRLKIEAGCGIREIVKAGCGMKTERRDRDMLCFVGGIRDRTGICEIIT